MGLDSLWGSIPCQTLLACGKCCCRQDFCLELGYGLCDWSSQSPIDASSCLSSFSSSKRLGFSDVPLLQTGLCLSKSDHPEIHESEYLE